MLQNDGVRIGTHRSPNRGTADARLAARGATLVIIVRTLCGARGLTSVLEKLPGAGLGNPKHRSEAERDCEPEVHPLTLRAARAEDQ